MLFLLACALPRRGGQWYLGKNFRPSHGSRLYGEPSPDKPKSFTHSYQADSCGRVTKVRFKTPANIRDAKTDTIRVRAEFNLRALGLAVFNHIAERLLGDSK
jgi:hypothetical protein